MTCLDATLPEPIAWKGFTSLTIANQRSVANLWVSGDIKVRETQKEDEPMDADSAASGQDPMNADSATLGHLLPCRLDTSPSPRDRRK